MGFEWSYWSLNRAMERGIHEYEVDQVRRNRPWPRPTERNGRGFMTLWGRTDAGRPLMIAAYRADRWVWEILDLRELTPAEAAEYDQWKDSQR